MDELFQRASENFPLKEPDNHWDAIQAKLNNSNNQTATITGKRPIMLYALFAIMFLHLPFMLFDNIDKDKISGTDVVLGKIKDKEGFPQENKHISRNEIVTENAVTPILNNKDITFKFERLLIADEPLKANQTSLQFNKLNDNNVVVDSSTRNEFFYQTNADNLEQTTSDINQVNIINPDTVTVDETFLTNILVESTLIDSNENKDTEKPIKRTKSGLYAGINAGISLSLVKGQQLSSPGFTAGIGLGYRFSPSWSAETGIKFSEKRYYSDGSYFSKKNMPQDLKVISVNSRTLLYEIPVKAKYDFRKTSKGQYFLTGGMSTFIVGKEINDYIIKRFGTNSPMLATYNKNKLYFAATIEISAGYEKHLKNKQTLRVEPYIQIAREGIGIGQLPVSGFGIQAGYFFRK